MSLDDKQIKSAVKALVKHVTSKKSTDLISDDAVIWLIVGTKKIPDTRKTMPKRLALKHSVLSQGAEVCLFTKDPQKEFKELLSAKQVKRVNKVMGISKLRDKYKPFEAKRKLCAAYGMFLADDRIIPLLPKLLGKDFFLKKKQPIPVDLKKPNLKAEIQKALDSTYMHLNAGSCSAIKVGTTAMSEQQIFENILTVVPQVVDNIPKKWKNIQSINIKTSDSISLPIFNALPDEVQAISTGRANDEGSEEEADSEDEE
ncbi:proteasome-interacting protein cic1 [Umbelopsis nana]